MTNVADIYAPNSSPRNLLIEVRVLPVVVLEDNTAATAVARALATGGLPIVEITMRTAKATEAIRTIVDSSIDIMVGAGTVLSAEDVDRAVDAGADFLVSPGLSESVFARAQHLNVPLVPGVATATEVQRAQELGFNLLKFFPAGPNGGPDALRAMKGPFPIARFIPTGGVTQDNAVDYIETGNVLAVGGTWIVPPDVVRSRDFGQIEELARTARERVERHYSR